MIKRSHIWLLMSMLLLAGTGYASQKNQQETVILIHGILNRPFMMKKIEKALEKNGFRTINWGYDSTEKSIEEYAADLKVFVAEQKLKGPVHFVGFSLGSIIARYYLATTPPPNLGRFVQIAPPNHGSPMVNKHEDFAPFGWIYGDKAIDQLRDGSIFLLELGVPDCDIGIIVGGKGNKEGYNRSIPGDDDGSVALASSKLEVSHDLVQVKSQHTALLFKDETAQETVQFVKQGYFRNGGNCFTPSTAPSGLLLPGGEGNPERVPSPLGRGEGEGVRPASDERIVIP